jgi:glycosyltransferase involved in cell wall biosynthesis
MEQNAVAIHRDDQSARLVRMIVAPDWRAGISYQEDLAKALVRENVESLFLTNYRRGLPLLRGCNDVGPYDGIHLHWPEAYFAQSGWWWKIRFIADLFAAKWRRPLFLTAHNLYPHERKQEIMMRPTVQFVVQKASAIFVHSAAARDLYVSEFGAAPEKCHKIPFGDHAEYIGVPLNREEARKQLDLPLDEPICLMFGTVTPYKGQEDAIAAWKSVRMCARLVIVGPPSSQAYKEKLQSICEGAPNITLRLGAWLQAAELRQWLSAADASVFNYRDILTSGAACLARSFGLPVLFPQRLRAVDIGEPHASVERFAEFCGDFPAKLERAIARGLNYEEASDWREQTRWNCVATETARVYRQIICP